VVCVCVCVCVCVMNDKKGEEQQTLRGTVSIASEVSQGGAKKKSKTAKKMWLMVVLLGTFVSHTTSAYSNVYFQDTPVGEYSDYTSPRVLLNGDCAMFRVRFSGGSDVALKVTLEVQNYDSYRPNVEYLAIAAPSWGMFLFYLSSSR
jgi:hypothetical protein